MKLIIFLLTMLSPVIAHAYYHAVTQENGYSNKRHEEYERVWNGPQTGFEEACWACSEATINSLIDDMDRWCHDKTLKKDDCPLTSDQKTTLQKEGYHIVKSQFDSVMADLMIIGMIQDATRKLEKTANGNHPYYHYRGLAEFRLSWKASSRILKLQFQIYDGMVDKWRTIATPEQSAATDKITSHSGNGASLYFDKKRRIIYFQYLRRNVDGEIDEKEFKQRGIDPSGTHDLHELISYLPMSYSPYGEKLWHFSVALFVHRYNLTPAQQQAVSVILEDSLKKAGEYRQRHAAQLQRLWKQLLTAYLFPKESNVTVKQAMRQFRRASQNAVRPIYEKMQKRLMGLLTSKQKHAAGPPPPKPKWMELMEIALQDDDPPVAAQAKPSTAATTQPTAAPHAQGQSQP